MLYFSSLTLSLISPTSAEAIVTRCIPIRHHKERATRDTALRRHGGTPET